jgi:hypothetical protein
MQACLFIGTPIHAEWRGWTPRGSFICIDEIKARDSAPIRARQRQSTFHRAPDILRRRCGNGVIEVNHIWPHACGRIRP